MIYNTSLHTLARAFKFEMLVHVLCIFMLVLALALVLVLVLVRVDAGTGRLKSCYSNAQPSRLPLQLCRGNNKAHSSWFVGSTEAIVMHNHRGLTRTINANHGRGNPHVSLIAMKR